MGRRGLSGGSSRSELGYVALSVVVAPDSVDMPLFARVLFALEVASIGIVGALVATRQPRNVIGWILWSAAIAVTWSIAGDDYATTSLVAAGGTWPGTIWAAWLSGMTFLPAIITVLVFIPLLFPTGAAAQSAMAVGRLVHRARDRPLDPPCGLRARAVGSSERS